MKRIVSIACLASLLFCSFPSSACAELSDPFNDYIAGLMADGMSYQQIANAAHKERGLAAFDVHSLAVLYLCILLEMQEQGITVDIPLQPDVSSMTYDELVALNGQINAAMAKQNKIDAITVPMGEYTVGVDIPAGAYSIKIAEVTSPYRIPSSTITVYSKSGVIDERFYLSNATPVIGKVTLKDGYTIKISGDSILLSSYKGIGY